MKQWLFAFGFALLVLGPVALSAQQQASVLGTVLDESKAVLPGVTVTATDLSSGRVYTGVTDERGEFRLLNIDPGRYKVQAELPGFATVAVPQIELLVGQNANIPFVLAVATLRETVMVTGESPLVDISSSEVAGRHPSALSASRMLSPAHTIRHKMSASPAPAWAIAESNRRLASI